MKNKRGIGREGNVNVCPFCGSGQIAVVDSRPRGNTIWRRRKCLECEKKYTTYEVLSDTYTNILEMLSLVDNLEKIIKAVKGKKRGKNG